MDVEGRPIVKIREIAFDPKARAFTLAFERGGSATVKMARTDQNRNTLEVALDKGIEGRPFAALRSMYVTDFNNDVARVAVREKGGSGWREEPIMTFKRAASAVDLWTGRVSSSRHNTSSPTWCSMALPTAGSGTRRPHQRRCVIAAIAGGVPVARTGRPTLLASI